MKALAPIAATLILLAAPAAAQQAPAPSSNPEMMRIFAEDQTDRQAAPNIDWKAVAARDEQRRAATHKLLADGALHTGKDYNAAAFVFQHGREASDFLLAHTLAVVAVAKGEQGAVWIASATLDRYLMKVGQPQVFGTQYLINKQSQTAAWTQEPYARDLISDALRRELGVPVQAEQAEQMAKMPLPRPAGAPTP